MQQIKMEPALTNLGHVLPEVLLDPEPAFQLDELFDFELVHI